jgi:hypothetical protein
MLPGSSFYGLKSSTSRNWLLWWFFRFLGFHKKWGGWLNPLRGDK